MYLEFQCAQYIVDGNSVHARARSLQRKMKSIKFIQSINYYRVKRSAVISPLMAATLAAMRRNENNVKCEIVNAIAVR